MIDQAIAIFCICEEIVKCFRLIDDPQCKMLTSEIMTFAIISATQYHSNFQKTRIASIALDDKAYTDYSLEDDLLEMMQITFLPKRKKNLKRQHTGYQEFIISLKRNYIETVFSSIMSRMPRYIRAITEKGFYLKILLFIIAHLVCLSFQQNC